MSGIKETGANALPPQAAVAVDSRIARKCAQMEAGQVLITEAARHAAEAKEQLLKEHEAKKEERSENREEAQEKRDTPELSRQSRWFGIEGKLLKDAEIEWTLEMEEELWNELLMWMPSDDKGLAVQLKELSRLYLALLDAILIHTMGDAQAVQIGRLEEVLAAKLNLILDSDLNHLLELLEETGQTETAKLVKSSVYKQTTGKSISAGAADRFYTRGKMNSAGNSRFFMPDSQGQAAGSSRGNKGMYTASASNVTAGGLSAASEEEGRVYQLAKGGNVRMSREFDAHRRSGELQMSQRNRALSGTVGSDTGSKGISGGKTTFTSKELEGGNRFAAHMNGSGNLFKNPGISARNEEVVGLLAAITSIKNQMYSESAGRGSGMKAPLKSAVNQMIDYYLTRKGVYNVYNYTTHAYEKTGSPQKAFEEGLEYAYRIFMDKKNDAVYRQQAAYSEEAGFFQSLLKGQSIQADLIRGMRLLESNWREFLKTAGESEKKGISLKVQKHSPWGFLMEPEGIGKDGSKDKEKVFLTRIACVAALVAGYLCYRLFFG
ncbi:hypothetical protein IMSAGC020_01053 [Lachnospiraceae bacterium]|nr:hypothetical protein IMSAGC020_01053 [Lachnospiraceae bacterium]